MPQCTTDEPASELLSRIRKKREDLIAAKKIKNTKIAPITEDEIPFEIPKSWEWVRFQTIVYKVGSKNNQIKAKEVKKEGLYPVISQSSVSYIDGYCNDASKLIKNLPVLLFGDHTRAVKFINEPFIIGADGTQCHNVIEVNPHFVYLLMQYASEKLKNRGYARHYSLLKDFLLLLPPLPEQHRIVEK